MTWFTLWLMCSDGLEGGKSGTEKTIRGLLEPSSKTNVAGARVMA